VLLKIFSPRSMNCVHEMVTVASVVIKLHAIDRCKHTDP